MLISFIYLNKCCEKQLWVSSFKLEFCYKMWNGIYKEKHEIVKDIVWGKNDEFLGVGDLDWRKSA